MSLVPYPDSDDDASPDDKSSTAPAQKDEDSSKPTVKRKRDASSRSELPPLPAAFHDLYSTNARASTSDDPSLHGGRKRAVPHVEGNWPSHVYLEWVPSHAESEALHNLIESIQEAIARANKTRSKPLPVPEITLSLRSPLGAPLPLHVSLSRTLQIKTDGRDKFVDTLTTSLRRASVRPFGIHFATLKWVPNFQRNRWFLVLGIVRPAQDELNKLLGACNNAVETCGHPGLYTGGTGDGPMEDNDPQAHATKRRKSAPHEGGQKMAGNENIDCTKNFHISIAWNLVEPDLEWMSLLANIDVNKHIQAPEAHFDAVKVKVGNIVHNIGLATRKGGASKGAGILGLR